MKDSLRAGITHTFRFPVDASKTVPALFPEATEFKVMPEVLATGFMVGFVEWACIQAVNPHIDWPNEQTVGVHVNLSHLAATPPGMEIQAEVALTEVNGRKLIFDVSVRDDVDLICTGNHERFVIDAAKFKQKLARKSAGLK
jgi:fluoroacetyl-CoA thioesterase